MDGQRRVTVDVTPRMYAEHDGLHGALQEAVYRELEEDPGLQEFFGLRRPNRFIPEDADTTLWEDTEDAVYTGSDPREETTLKGRYAIVQCISCRAKTGYGFDKVAKQFEYFERSDRNGFDDAPLADGHTGWYVAAADLPVEDVHAVNAELRTDAVRYEHRLLDGLYEASRDATVHRLSYLPETDLVHRHLPAIEQRYRETVGDPAPPTTAVPVTLYELERTDLAAIEAAITDAFAALFGDHPVAAARPGD